MRQIDADRLLEERRIHTYYHLPNGDIAIPLIDIKNAPTIEPSAQPERCSDCIAHGGDWECDHIHCRKGRLPSAQINYIVNNDIHLCESCKYSYPSCPSSKFDVFFGDSVGHDNICACNKYQPRYDEEWRKMHYESSYSQGFLEGVKMCEQAQPKQKIGKWVDYGDPLSWVCSECGYRVARYNNTPHCPNCGVKMINVRGEQEGE